MARASSSASQNPKAPNQRIDASPSNQRWGCQAPGRSRISTLYPHGACFRSLIGTSQPMNDRDRELLRRYQSAKPLRREVLLLGMAAVTFLLTYFQLTPYPATNLIGLGGGLLIGAVVSY